MRTVYRVEVPLSERLWGGVYHYGYETSNERIKAYMRAVYASHNFCDCHPNPKVESNYAFEFMNDHRCGFKSTKQMIKWFGGFLPELLKRGARIKKYKVPDSAIVFESDKQLVFDLRLVIE